VQYALKLYDPKHTLVFLDISRQFSIHNRQKSTKMYKPILNINDLIEYCNASHNICLLPADVYGAKQASQGLLKASKSVQSCQSYKMKIKRLWYEQR